MIMQLPSHCPGSCGNLVALFKDHCEKIEGKLPCNWIICPDQKCGCTIDTKLGRYYYIRGNQTISSNFF